MFLSSLDRGLTPEAALAAVAAAHAEAQGSGVNGLQSRLTEIEKRFVSLVSPAAYREHPGVITCITGIWVLLGVLYPVCRVYGGSLEVFYCMLPCNPDQKQRYNYTGNRV